MGEQVEVRPAAKPGNAAIYMMTTTMQAHYQLSQMADQKASMLMGATSLIFTITVGFAKGSSTLPLALLTLGGFSLIAAVFAVLTVLPSTSPRRRDSPMNPLFFGSFACFSQEQYVEQVMATLKEEEAIYRSFAVSIYQNGCVLARRKYRMLGYGYRVFLLGLVASLIVFVVNWGRH